MSSNLTILTDSGLYRGGFSSGTEMSDAISGASSPLTGFVSKDTLFPQLRLIDQGSSKLTSFDLSDMTQYNESAESFPNSISVAEDGSTGDFYILSKGEISGQSSSSSSQSEEGGGPKQVTLLNYKARIWKYSSLTGLYTEFIPVRSGKIVNLTGALDCKVDQSSRRLWVSAGGKGAIYGINLDTSKVEVSHEVENMYIPNTLCCREGHAEIFVRAFNLSNSTEYIWEINDTGLVNSWTTENAKSWNNIPADLYEGRLVLPSTDSMRYDPVRDRLWWVTGHEDHRVYMLDMVSLTGHGLLAEPTAEPNSSSSSVSSSSESSISSSSSSSKSSSLNSSSSSSSSSSISSTSSSLIYSSSSSSISTSSWSTEINFGSSSSLNSSSSSESSSSSISSSSDSSLSSSSDSSISTTSESSLLCADSYIASGFAAIEDPSYPEFGSVNGTYTWNGYLQEGKKIYQSDSNYRFSMHSYQNRWYITRPLIVSPAGQVDGHSSYRQSTEGGECPDSLPWLVYEGAYPAGTATEVT